MHVPGRRRYAGVTRYHRPAEDDGAVPAGQNVRQRPGPGGAIPVVSGRYSMVQLVHARQVQQEGYQQE